MRASAGGEGRGAGRVRAFSMICLTKATLSLHCWGWSLGEYAESPGWQCYDAVDWHASERARKARHWQQACTRRAHPVGKLWAFPNCRGDRVLRWRS